MFSLVWLCVMSEEPFKVRSFFSVSLVGVRLSPLGTSATVDLLYQPRMMIIEQLVE
jgi:hypothetical protein